MSEQTIWQQLAAPFPPDVVKERQGPKKHADACTKQYGQCTQPHMMLSYVDARDVAERLDGVATPLGWEFEAKAVPNTNVVHGRLAVRDIAHSPAGVDTWVAREDHGYPNSDADEEPLKSATSDALKRCAVLFGIGRHLYDDNHPTRPASKPVQAPQSHAAPPKPAPAPSDDREPYPWDGMGVPEQVAEIFEGDVDESKCPDHHKLFKSGSKGWFCSTPVEKDGDRVTKWCQRKPSKAWQAAQELIPA